MPKVSVIIPVYNVEKYLRECLDSVVNQTLKDIEIICINDGSPDNSLAILEEYAKKDSRIRIINKKNQGQSIARNIGINLAKGEYVVFIDPDDYFRLDALEKMYAKITETKVDIVISHCQAFADDKSCNKQQKKVANFNKFLTPKTIDSLDITIDNLEFYLEEIPIMLWGKMFSLEFLNKNNIRIINKNIVHEDDGFNIKVLSSFPKISVIENLSVMYRIRKNSSVSNIYKIKNREKHENNMQEALNDAITFILKKHEQYIGERIVNIIQESLKYSRFFQYKFLGSKIYWHKYDKKIELFFIPLLREKVREQQLVMKFLGFPIYKKKLIKKLA